MPVEPLTQWWCDACGELIEDRRQGVVEFRYDLHAPKESRHQSFRIVHNGYAGDRGLPDGLFGCIEKGADKRGLGEVPLTDFVDGLGVLRMLGLRAPKRRGTRRFVAARCRTSRKHAACSSALPRTATRPSPRSSNTRTLEMIIAKYVDADR
jgi:hypothetical protein